MSNAQDKPRKRRGCLKVFLIIFIFFAAIAAVGTFFLFRGVPIAELPTLASSATGGMVIVTIDPTDPELLGLLESLSDGQVKLRGRAAGFIGGMLRSAIDPNIVIVSRYEPGGDPSDRATYFAEHEGLAGAAQFHRFLPIVYKAVRRAGGTTKRGAEVRIGADYVRFVAPNGGPSPALTRSAIVVGTSEEATTGLLSRLTSADTAEIEFPSDLHRELYERAAKSLGQIKGYFVAPEGRLESLIEAWRASRADNGEIAPGLDAAALRQFDEGIDAIFIEGELLSADSAELRLALIASGADAADLLEGVMKEHFVPTLADQLGAQAVSVEREGDEVALIVRLTGLKEMIEQGGRDRR